MLAATHLGPRWLVNADTEMSLLATVGQSWTAGEVQNRTLGARLEVKHRLSRRLRARGEVSWKRRDFESSEHLDGPLLGFVGSTTWFPSSTVQVRAAGGYNRERTTSLAWRNATRWARAGVSVVLPYGFTLGAALSSGGHATRGGGACSPPAVCPARIGPASCEPRCSIVR